MLWFISIRIVHRPETVNQVREKIVALRVTVIPNRQKKKIHHVVALHVMQNLHRPDDRLRATSMWPRSHHAIKRAANRRNCDTFPKRRWCAITTKKRISVWPKTHTAHARHPNKTTWTFQIRHEFLIFHPHRKFQQNKKTNFLSNNIFLIT